MSYTFGQQFTNSRGSSSSILPTSPHVLQNNKLMDSFFQTVNDNPTDMITLYNTNRNKYSAKIKGGWVILGSVLEVVLLLSLTSYNTFYSLFKVSQLNLGQKVPGSNKSSFIANIGNVSSCNQYKMATSYLCIYCLDIVQLFKYP